MPYQWTAKNIVSINPISFISDDGITVSKLICQCEVNYGEFGLSHTIDLWIDMNDTQKARVQAIFDAIKVGLERIILQ